MCILGSSQYVRAKDSVSGKYYTMEHQYYTDPSVSDRDFFAAICSAEAGVQRKNRYDGSCDGHPEPDGGTEYFAPHRDL